MHRLQAILITPLPHVLVWRRVCATCFACLLHAQAARTQLRGQPTAVLPALAPSGRCGLAPAGSGQRRCTPVRRTAARLAAHTGLMWQNRLGEGSLVAAGRSCSGRTVARNGRATLATLDRCGHCTLPAPVRSWHKAEDGTSISKLHRCSRQSCSDFLHASAPPAEEARPAGCIQQRVLRLRLSLSLAPQRLVFWGRVAACP